MRYAIFLNFQRSNPKVNYLANGNLFYILVKNKYQDDN
jgi:hypothetical protein